MKYEICKDYYNQILFQLINFLEMFRLNDGVDHISIKQLETTIEMLRYYRQFAK